ncbi:hypothetical protein AgCh_029301 [Apium graveolens]
MEVETLVAFLSLLLLLAGMTLALDGPEVAAAFVDVPAVAVVGVEEVSTDIEDLQRIRNKASTDVSKASTDNIHQRISASTDKTSTANASTDKASTDKASMDKASTDA